MKSFLKIGLFVLVFLCSIGLGLKVRAEDNISISSEESYSVAFVNGRYEAYGSIGNKADPLFISESISEIMSFITSENTDCRIRFVDIVCSEDVIFAKGDYVISGSLCFEKNFGMVTENANLVFSDLSLTLKDGGIRIKSGSLTIDNSSIAGEKTVIKMDYSSMSQLTLNSGSILSDSSDATLQLLRGTAKIRGGSVRNTNGYAIDTASTLFLSGDPVFSGVDYDIYASSPITLSEGEKNFLGDCSIKYNCEFEKGNVSIIAYGACAENEGNVSLYDFFGREIKTKYYEKFSGTAENDFLTAYIPYEISFGGSSEYESLYYLSGEKVVLPEVEDRLGYEFLGWKEGGYDGENFEESLPIFSDVVLYPSYRLSAPTFSFMSMSFTYDGKERQLMLRDLYHPLISEGVMTYKWYKDGKELSLYGDKISLKNVENSGKYKCMFTFSHDIYTVSVETPEISVEIFKQKIDIPKILDVEYNGEMRYPEIYSVSLYEVLCAGGIDAGRYPVKLTLRDTENYGFGENLDSSVTVDFNIIKAENKWIEDVRCSDVFLWQRISPTATAKFGSVKFLYSESSDGIYTENIPDKVGVYYIKGEVEETENYSFLTSDPLRFSVLEDSIASLHIVNDAAKKSYVAFESFSPDGLSVAAMYISGREVLIDNSALDFLYSNGSYFLFGDSSIQIIYSEKKLLYPITVSKAEYDISDIIFPDCEYEYSAKYISPEFFGNLPIGIDGIPLSATVIGGGIGVGTYATELRFYSESENYFIPESIKGKLTVTPKAVEVVWQNLTFVFDGKTKLPSAYYVDLSGKEIMLQVSGAHSYAGVYEGTVSISDANYKPKNPTVAYTINKADYDLSAVCWSAVKLIYNGKEQAITVDGLPIGVVAIGYSDNRATDAGSYTASVVVSYDERNYNPPDILPFKWEILPAKYDETLFSFSDAVYIYDGEAHFPIFSGSMPQGMDGSSPSFTYKGSATNVDDGKVRVVIEFFTESKNYVAPDSIECFVEILPKGIDVVWNDLSFVYSDSLFIPSAEAEECEITVVGAAKNAGKHTATAKTLNTNYYIINSECIFEIFKAENSWQVNPSIADIYESGVLSPLGTAAFGDTEYLYSQDKLNITEMPSFSGIFYFKAVSEGNKNYLPIESEWIEFEIIEVKAVGIYVEMLRSEFLTLEKISDSDANVFVLFNDSSKTQIPISETEIRYENGEGFSYSDGSVAISYLDFCDVKDVTVMKRDYDLTSISWSGLHGVYDGKEKNAYITGLPSGVNVIKYVGNGAINAGEYVISAVLSYDEKNYNPPVIADAIMKIEKQTVVIPDIESIEYSARLLFPDIKTENLYDYEFSGAKDAGIYTLTFTIGNYENYCFEGNAMSVEKTFEILKRKLIISVSDVEIYLGGKQSEVTFAIVEGSFADGDVLIPTYKIEKETVFAEFDTENYEIKVLPGAVLRHNRLSSEDASMLGIIFLIITAGLITIIIIFLNRKRLQAYYLRLFLKSDNFIPTMPIIDDAKGEDIIVDTDSADGISSNFSNTETSYEENNKTLDDENYEFEEECESEENDVDLYNKIEYSSDNSTVIDVGYADSAISDSLARSLIRNETEIKTIGRRKEIINVDTLSRSFSAGERVDINLLKGKSLIPYDTGYIKVLARGIIDKPLDVYANDFSLSAVKMIALAGGKSVKVASSNVMKSRPNHRNVNFDKRA